jgi:hypothetical protein
MNYSLLNIMFGLNYNEAIRGGVQQPEDVKRSLWNKTAKVFGNGVSRSKIQKDGHAWPSHPEAGIRAAGIINRY